MDGSVVIVGFGGLLALTWKVIDLLRLLGSFREHRSGVVTQILSFIGGIAAVALFAASDFGQGVEIPGSEFTLDSLNGYSQIVLGLMVGSAASVAVDVKQAIDGRDTASKPDLL